MIPFHGANATALPRAVAHRQQRLVGAHRCFSMISLTYFGMSFWSSIVLLLSRS
jgi:hypothetical protein